MGKRGCQRHGGMPVPARLQIIVPRACERGCEPRAQQVSPGATDVLSPLWEMCCLRLAGSQPGSWGLTAHHCHRLSVSCATVLLRWKQKTGHPQVRRRPSRTHLGVIGSSHPGTSTSSTLPHCLGWWQRQHGPSSIITLLQLLEPLWNHPTGPGGLPPHTDLHHLL